MVYLTPFPGLQVEVMCAGESLIEHTDASEPVPSNTTLRYISAETGSPFQIRYRVARDAPLLKTGGLAVKVSVDGMACSRPVLSTKFLSQHPAPMTKGVSSVDETGKWTLRRFMFSDLHAVGTSSKAQRNMRPERLTQVGEIKVEFWLIKSSTADPAERWVQNRADPSKLGKIKETKRMLKELSAEGPSHRITLGSSEKIDNRKYQAVQYIDDPKSPGGIAIFRYRSKGTIERMFPGSDGIQYEEYDGLPTYESLMRVGETKGHWKSEVF